MTDPAPITQCDGVVLIQTPQMLAAAYRATLYGIQRRIRDGLPTGDLRPHAWHSLLTPLSKDRFSY
jgi:hypothetical protein